jgi:hypothetical protein
MSRNHTHDVLDILLFDHGHCRDHAGGSTAQLQPRVIFRLLLFTTPCMMSSLYVLRYSSPVLSVQSLSSHSQHCGSRDRCGLPSTHIRVAGSYLVLMDFALDRSMLSMLESQHQESLVHTIYMCITRTASCMRHPHLAGNIAYNASWAIMAQTGLRRRPDTA